jgi:two-component system chemotaxis response regulator CheY
MKKNILIVDDSRLIQTIAKKAVIKKNCNAIIATNGEEGLERLEENDIDLIFSDINMPIMDGSHFIHKIKEHDKFHFIPIVMLTVVDDENIKKEFRDLGVKAWLMKPFNEKRFLFTIDKILGVAE